ncbi:MAG TPA: hypothetical protein VGR74_01380, partial [Actinomycetota bacterium]|nr:hypothetical protein [Actinomycetota bacterium]
MTGGVRGTPRGCPGGSGGVRGTPRGCPGGSGGVRGTPRGCPGGSLRGHGGLKPLEAGERVLLQDAKGRRYLVTLERGGSFHTHRGRLDHDRLIGAAEGTV